MAFERAPTFKFDTPQDLGFNSVPDGALILIESTFTLYVKNNDITLSSGVQDDLESAISFGAVTPVYNTNDIFDFMYYADSQESRVVGMDPHTMKLIKNIPCTDGNEAGSCDRAGYRDTMYVRSNSGKYLDVVNMVDGNLVGQIALPGIPSSSGVYNKYLDLTLVALADLPQASIIDCATNTLIATVGSSTTGDPKGNLPSESQTGEPVWLDGRHFAVLNRVDPSIMVYKIDGDYPPYSITGTQTLALTSACSLMKSEENNTLLSDTVFYASLEGQPTKPATMVKFDFDSVQGELIEKISKETCTDDSDTSMHFAVKNGVIAISYSVSNSLKLLNTSDLMPATNLMPVLNVYDLGVAPKVQSGHVCIDGNTVVVANQQGKSISIVDLTANSVKDVDVPSLANVNEGTGNTISYGNRIVNDKYYFFACFYNETTSGTVTDEGTFYEYDITSNMITRSTVVGGSPTKSTSLYDV